MLLVITHTDHTFAHANLDILEMDAIVPVKLIISEAFRFFSTITIIFLFVVVVFFVVFYTMESQYLIFVT